MEASSPRKQGDVSRLVNTQIDLQTDSCLTFWYHMYGQTIGSLAVYDQTASGNPALIWSQIGDKRDKWRNARVHSTVHFWCL